MTKLRGNLLRKLPLFFFRQKSGKYCFFAKKFFGFHGKSMVFHGKRQNICHLPTFCRIFAGEKLLTNCEFVHNLFINWPKNGHFWVIFAIFFHEVTFFSMKDKFSGKKANIF